MRFLFSAKIVSEGQIEVTDLATLDLRSIPMIYHNRLRMLTVGSQVCYETVIFEGSRQGPPLETTRHTCFTRAE